MTIPTIRIDHLQAISILDSRGYRTVSAVNGEIAGMPCGRDWSDIGDIDSALAELNGAEHGCSNAALIRPNQIGTVSQTSDAIPTAKQMRTARMVSRRSGETADTFIADLVVGTGVGQIKSGAPAHGEQVAKYNRLTDIEPDTPDLRFGLTRTEAR